MLKSLSQYTEYGNSSSRQIIPLQGRELEVDNIKGSLTVEVSPWFMQINYANKLIWIAVQIGLHMRSFCQYMLHTHSDSSDRLRRSHITQYRYGYCKWQYLWGYYEGTLTLLWQKAEKLLRMQ